MKFFLLTMLVFASLGVLLRGKPERVRSLALAGMTAFVCVAYYFLRQI